MIQHPVHISEEIKTLIITSDVFKEEAFIPKKYTCDGENVNPPLTIQNIPHEAKSIVLIIEDPDAPSGTWTHWIVWNIPPSGKIKEKSIPGIEGLNDYGEQNYRGPCPPSGIHRYFFKVYALDRVIGLKPAATKVELEKAINPNIIGFGELVGVYEREI